MTGLGFLRACLGAMAAAEAGTAAVVAMLPMRPDQVPLATLVVRDCVGGAGIAIALLMLASWVERHD